MKKEKRYTEEQIIRILREAESGEEIALANLRYRSSEETCQQHCEGDLNGPR